jgi:hypothetical protein
VLSLDKIQAKLEVISASQCVLLAALNGIEEKVHRLDAKLQATGDGLADEVKQLKAAVSFFAQATLKKKGKK